MISQQALSPVRVLPETASLDQVVELVNNNTAKVETLFAPGVSVRGNSFPHLTAVLAYENPKHLRLRAKTAFSGPEVDLGSNDDLFWFWIRRNDPPAVYYCRHEAYAQTPAGQALPVNPEWLVEALGLVKFDNQVRHEGPLPLADGRLEIRSFLPSANGIHTRVTVVDASQGWVLEQHLYDGQGRRIASAIASEHRRDPASDVTLPHRVAIEWPSAQVSLTLDLREVVINQTTPFDAELWNKPSPDDAPQVDLADPSVAPGGGLPGSAGPAVARGR